MITRGAALGLVGLFFAASLAMAQDAAPPLDPPALVPPSTVPAAPVPTPRAPSGRPENRPLLVIPGVTAPLPPKPAARAGRARANPGEDLSKPALTPPANPPAEAPSGRQATPADRNASPRAVIPLTLEPITEDIAPDPGPDQTRAPQSSRPKDARADAPALPARVTTNKPRSASARGSSTMLGRLIGPNGSSEGHARPDSSITVEPRSDPAAEAAVKRRVEKQIQQTLGDRVRSVEVRVSGKAVVIRAQAARFWQRRAVRRSLESLQLPSGYRRQVEILD
jgi:hypothetical protein